MAPTDVGDDLLDALRQRDFDRIGRCFGGGASFRALTPGPLREMSGSGEAAARYAYWFGELAEFTVLSADCTTVADRIRIRYHVRGRDPDKGWQETEHTAYARVEEGRIAAMTLTCSGFRPAAEPS
jgi:hypothetical protein